MGNECIQVSNVLIFVFVVCVLMVIQLPGTQLGYLLGEALTLRAIYYADLVKAWGDVPGTI